MEKITIDIEGMMCPKCEKHVEEALMCIDGIKKAKASFKKCEAVISCEKEVAPENLKQAVEEAGYKFNGVRN